MGLGITIGPIICSLVFGWLGFAGTFFFVAGYIFIFGLVCTYFVPKRLD
jgi:hypothetical protein